MSASTSTYPTADAAYRMLQGEFGGLFDSVSWTLWRAVLAGTGMYLSGEREDVVAKALIGSLTVEAFVILWAATAAEEQARTLPSYKAALSGEPHRILLTCLVRAGIIYGGLRLFGRRKRAFRNALAGAAAIETSVMFLAYLAKSNEALAAVAPAISDKP
jgi:hypothetical protein